MTNWGIILLKFTLDVNEFIGFHYRFPYKSLGATAYNRLVLRRLYTSGKNVSLKPYRSAPLLVLPVYINSSSFEITCNSDGIAYNRKYGWGCCDPPCPPVKAWKQSVGLHQMILLQRHTNELPKRLVFWIKGELFTVDCWVGN